MHLVGTISDDMIINGVYRADCDPVHSGDDEGTFFVSLSPSTKDPEDPDILSSHEVTKL